MKIAVSKGLGIGPTELSAFDQALVNAGVANFNLIYLSSVLPPGSDVVVTENPEKPIGEWGDKLYVVMAQMRTIHRNQEVWAGVGWIQDENTSDTRVEFIVIEHKGRGCN